MKLFNYIISCLKTIYFLFKNKPIKVQNKNLVVITIFPWYLNTTPFFFIYIYHLLRIQNINSVIIYDDLADEQSFIEKIENKLIQLTLKLTVKKNHLNFLSKYEVNNKIKSQLDLRFIIKQSVREFFHDNFSDEEIPLSKIKLKIKSNQKKFVFFQNFVSKNKNIRSLIIPNGMCKGTSMIVHSCKKNNLNFITIDSGGDRYPYNLFCFSKGIVSQFEDINEAYFYLLKNRNLYKMILNLSAIEFEKRKFGKDNLRHQLIEPNVDFKISKKYILILLSVSWDMPSINTHTVFNNLSDWLKSTVHYLNQFQDFDIFVRQHPLERVDGLASKNKYLFLKNYPNIKFIASDQMINTYDLIENAYLIIGHNSTALIESQIMGKNIVSTSSIPQIQILTNKIFETKEAYFLKIESLLKNQSIVSSEIREKALIIYYLCQKLTFFYSPIDPVSNFNKFIKNKPKIYLKTRFNYFLKHLIIKDANFIIKRLEKIENKFKKIKF